MKILVAVDGSKHSLDAVQCLIDHTDWYREAPTVELVTVHQPVPKLRGMSMVVSKADVQRHYEEEGRAQLAAAVKKLDAAKISYQARVLVGQPAETIVKHARDKRCELIYIGNRGVTAARNALLGSVASKVLHLSTVPVLLVK